MRELDIQLKNNKSIQFLPHWIWFLALCYVAVLPMANTIALRNVVLFTLLLSLVVQWLKDRFPIRLPLPVILWFSFIFLFPLVAALPLVAFENLIGQWGRGVLATVAGAGVAVILLNKDKNSVFYLGLASAFPILIHLGLFAWKSWMTSSIPWGYWGRETHHADLGYAAAQAVILLVAAAITGREKVLRYLAIILVFACFISTALANSRAGLVFCFLGVVLVFGASCLVQKRHNKISKHLMFGLASLLIAGAAILAMVVKEDVRWQNMSSKLLAGFEGDAVQIQCEGTVSVEANIISKYGVGEQAQGVIASLRDGDGARIVLLRAGIELALQHPWGLDGSRHAFQKILREKCANPVISMAHTHNGWIDTILALGWIGAALYMTVFLYYFKVGFYYLHREVLQNEWALVLPSLSIFWIIRGFIDSVFRDHMLEMQGFILAYAFVFLFKKNIKYYFKPIKL